MIRPLLAVALLVAFVMPVGAQQAKEDTPTVDIEAGRALLYTCGGCHGVPGYENAYPNYRVPRIAGQYSKYLVSALEQYASGARSHPTMGAQAGSLSPKQIRNVAAYLGSLERKQPVTYAPEAPLPKAAETCVACHGKDGQSIDPQYPRLAGQYASYIAQTLHEYRNGGRDNAIMKGFAAALSEDDIEALAKYYAGLPSTMDDLHDHLQGD